MDDLGDCCPHEGADEHGCWDCQNTGHAHAYDPNCPYAPFPEDWAETGRRTDR